MNFESAKININVLDVHAESNFNKSFYLFLKGQYFLLHKEASSFIHLPHINMK